MLGRIFGRPDKSTILKNTGKHYAACQKIITALSDMVQCSLFDENERIATLTEMQAMLDTVDLYLPAELLSGKKPPYSYDDMVNVMRYLYEVTENDQLTKQSAQALTHEYMRHLETLPDHLFCKIIRLYANAHTSKERQQTERYGDELLSEVKELVSAVLQHFRVNVQYSPVASVSNHAATMFSKGSVVPECNAISLPSSRNTSIQ